MPQQLTFDLPSKPALGRDAFFVSPSNALAVQKIEKWKEWPRNRMVLVGPSGSGKTHLAHVWAAEVGAKIVRAKDIFQDRIETFAACRFLVLEDVEMAIGNEDREVALFHLYNMLDASGASLLMTSRRPPARWNGVLPDLKSRLSSVDVVTMQAPDDGLLSALLVKLFKDRQIVINADLVGYLVKRMDRSADAIHQTVASLDRLSLESKRPITRQLAARLFDGSDP